MVELGCTPVGREAAVVGMAESRSFGFVALAAERVGLQRCLRSRSWRSQRQIPEVLAMDILRTVVAGIADSILGAGVVVKQGLDMKY